MDNYTRLTTSGPAIMLPNGHEKQTVTLANDMSKLTKKTEEYEGRRIQDWFTRQIIVKPTLLHSLMAVQRLGKTGFEAIIQKAKSGTFNDGSVERLLNVYEWENSDDFSLGVWEGQGDVAKIKGLVDLLTKGHRLSREIQFEHPQLSECSLKSFIAAAGNAKSEFKKIARSYLQGSHKAKWGLDLQHFIGDVLTGMGINWDECQVFRPIGHKWDYVIQSSPMTCVEVSYLNATGRGVTSRVHNLAAERRESQKRRLPIKIVFVGGGPGYILRDSDLVLLCNTADKCFGADANGIVDFCYFATKNCCEISTTKKAVREVMRETLSVWVAEKGEADEERYLQQWNWIE